MTTETKSSEIPTFVITDRDDIEYILSGIYMHEMERDEEFNSDDLYWFNINEVEYVPAVPPEPDGYRTDEIPATFRFYCYSTDECVLPPAPEPKEMANDFYFTIEHYFDKVAKLYIGCRRFDGENAETLYKWLSQRADIKEYIDKRLAVLNCTGFIDTSEPESEEQV